MGVITSIDSILKLLPVRWGLLVAVVVLTTLCLVQKGNLLITGLQLKDAESRSALATASLSTQNVAIKKAGKDMEEAKKRLQAANQKAAEIRKRLESRRTEIREVILQGDCPDMVQQVLDEVRR